jgi:hypothetical protein
MTFLIAFPLIAGSLAVLLLHSDRASRHPARNEGALIPAPVPGLLVPPGIFHASISNQLSENRVVPTSILDRGSCTLCQCRRPTGDSNRT